jgi:hypothetical protein
VNGWVEACENGRVGCRYGGIDGCRYGWIEGWVDGWMGGFVVWVDRVEILDSSLCISYEVKYMKIEAGKTSPRFIFGPEIFTL